MVSPKLLTDMYDSIICLLKRYGTQLAAASYTTVVVWDYPSCDLVLEFPTNFVHPEIIWNPFDPTMVAVYQV